MSGLACVKCKCFLKCKKNGVLVEEAMPLQGAVPSPQLGYVPELWRPYKLWIVDLAECPGCGFQLVLWAGAHHPISEHFMPDYETEKERNGPVLVRIDACSGYKP